MRRLYLTFALLSLASLGMAQVKMLKPYYCVTTYNVPGALPYVENALAIECSSAVYKEFEPGKWRASVEVVVDFRDPDQPDKHYAFSKVELNSPVATDTANIDGAFIHQERFQLANGEYKMSVFIKDLNNPNGRPSSDETIVVVDYPSDAPAISDILLFDSYAKAANPSSCTKSGCDFLPRVYPFFGIKDNKLNFYAEMYNSDKLYDDGKFLAVYYLQSCESSTRLKNFTFTKRFDVGKANALVNTIDISELPSGNYYLVIEMRDRANNLICSNSARFQRSNPGMSYENDDLDAVVIGTSFVSTMTLDSLRNYLSYLDPICSEAERDYCANLVKTSDLKTMRQFMLNFWNSRNPVNPGQGWEDYLGAVRRVNMSFSTTAYPGYRTDRGYVFLKYGEPDKIVEQPFEPGAYPYAIWHYYEVAHQRNKRFVFMSKDNALNDYQLIHSDVVGEINNPRWQLEIYSRNYQSQYDQGVDQESFEDIWGSQAGDLYNNPR